MKIYFPFLLLFVVFTVACSLETQKKETATQPKENEGLQVVRKPFRNSDRIEYEIPVVKGTQIKHGVQKRYYLHGSLYSTIPYVAGEKEGVAYTYYKASLDSKPQVWKEQPYVNNKLNGICKRYHNDGTLQAEYEYKNGLPGVGLKEYSQSGKALKQPTLVLAKNRVATGYYISARLSKSVDKVDYFIGDLIEDKYLPKNLKGLQVKKGLGEIIVSPTVDRVQITAVYYTRYRNKGLVTASIELP